MQAKDIPERPILEFLASLGDRWGTWFHKERGEEYDNSVVRAVPLGTPEKIILAKMRSLIKRGLVDGCPCGCRGDYVLTEKGKTLLAQSVGASDGERR